MKRSLCWLAASAMACSAAQDEPPGELVTTGVIGSETDHGFADIRSIALDPRGGVWVADVGDHRLTRWSDDGAFLEERGRVRGAFP